MRPAFLCVLAALTLTACGSSTKDIYRADEVGIVQEIQEGQIVTARPIRVESLNSTSGSTVGGLAGGIGTVLAVGNALGPFGFIVGSVVGGAIGYLVEDVAKDGTGIEYILRMEDGRIVTVVQNTEGNEEPLAEGSEVYLQFSQNYVRVLERPAGKTAPTEWQNPDNFPEDAAADRPGSTSP